MFDIEQLPNEIQLMIWTYAQKAAHDWADDLGLGLDDHDLKYNYIQPPYLNNLTPLALYRLVRIQRFTTDYIIYMKRVKRYELGINKNKPWPHYPPSALYSILGQLIL